MLNNIRQEMEQDIKLLTPFESLRDFSRKGIELTQSEKIEVVEECAVNWAWRLRADLEREILRLISCMIEKTDISFAFPQARISHLVNEAVRQYEEAKNSD